MKKDIRYEKESTKSISGLKAIQKKKLYEEIVEQIKELIVKGELKPGDKLPTERELVNVFQVSRHSIREAIRSLEQKKNVVTKPGSGTFVMSSDGESIVEYLAHVVMDEKDRLSEIFTFRRMLEPQIAALAAENACDTDIKEFESIVKKQNKKNISIQKFIELDSTFHLLIAKATKNRVLQRVVESINDILMECRSESLQSVKRTGLSIEGHSLILEAIKNKDTAAASKYMQQHLEYIEQTIRSTVDSKESGIDD